MASMLGKVAIVTGSSSGIGKAVAQRFAAEGASIVVNSSTSVAAGEAVAAALPAAIYVRADIADEDQCKALVAAAVSRYGRLDILVNNAATTAQIPHADLDAVTDEVWHKILGVNIIGTWYMTRAAVAAMREHGGGAVVNVTSLGGVRPLGSSVPYAVSKAALNHMTRLLANALAPEIRVNAVAPGLIDTPWTADSHELRKLTMSLAPLGRSGKPEEIAEVCHLAATATYMTGQVIVVDGGVHLR